MSLFTWSEDSLPLAVPVVDPVCPDGELTAPLLLCSVEVEEEELGVLLDCAPLEGEALDCDAAVPVVEFVLDWLETLPVED